MNCLLCHTPSTLFASETFLCPHCQLVFKNPLLHINKEAEIKRYTTHNNNEADVGYVNFLKRLSDPLTPFLKAEFDSLDFGCGPGPTLSILLDQKGGRTKNYDPIFFPDQKLLEEKYDIVTSSEVVEHFKNPEKDWNQLVSLVKPNGLLAVMTLFYHPGIDYKSWWYIKDPTHIVFYQEQTLLYLAEKFNLEIIFKDNTSVIIFRKI